MTTTIYKFRPLGTECDLCRAKQIIETRQFWCSRFWEMNDPMEGVFQFDPNGGIDVNQVFSEKASFSICSFSGKVAFKNPVIWGHYANAFKGIAIEVHVDSKTVDRVRYARDLHEALAKNGESRHARQILTTKLKRWIMECEYRFLVEGPPGLYKIGHITRIWFGDPYGHIVNKDQVHRDANAVRQYHTYRSALKDLARTRKVGTNDVRVSGGEVIVAEGAE